MGKMTFFQKDGTHNTIYYSNIYVEVTTNKSQKISRCNACKMKITMQNEIREEGFKTDYKATSNKM